MPCLFQFAISFQEIKPTMLEFQTMFPRQRKWMFFLLSFYVLGWGFTTYQSIFLGLILGTSLSLFNMWLMARKIDKLGKAVENGGRVRSIGSFSRMATGALAVVITMRYPDDLHLISVVFGLMTSYIVIMIDFFVQNFYSDK
jgi:ATP synthase protein I